MPKVVIFKDSGTEIAGIQDVGRVQLHDTGRGRVEHEDAPMDCLSHRMLVVEDDRATRTLLRRVLTLCGWEVIEAGSLTEGIARLDPPPDCLLLDLHLPDGDGEALLRKVRIERLPTRVVVNTGTEDATRLETVRGLHPDALLRKPLDSEGLKAVCGLV